MIVGRFRVSNIGNGNAGSFSVAFYLSNDGIKPGSLLKTNTVVRLRAGSYIDMPFEHISWLRQSGKYLVVVIDPDNSVVETNEKNNVVRQQIQ
jgi:subtilase family serine protease